MIFQPDETWMRWMYGASWLNNGTCYESGAVYIKQQWEGEPPPGAQIRVDQGIKNASLIQSTRADGTVVNYQFVYAQEPILFWHGYEMNAAGDVLRVRKYESSDFVRQMIADLQGGPTYAEYDLCPAVDFWLGRSWCNDDEQELLFAVTGNSAQLQMVADYYGLNVPYNDAQKAVLDTNPELYRARHYDLYGLGDGQFAPVIVASVTFVNKKPTRLLLYTFLRQWEFEDAIVMPTPAIK